MTLSEQTQAAYRDYEAAAKKRREIAATIKEKKEHDATLDDLAADKKTAAEAYKAEAAQFEARNADLFEQLDAAKASERDAKSIFDDLYVHASAATIAATGAVQLSLFADDGRRVHVDLVTKITVAKAGAAGAEAETKASLDRGLDDEENGRTVGPFASLAEMEQALDAPV